MISLICFAPDRVIAAFKRRAADSDRRRKAADPRNQELALMCSESIHSPEEN